MEKKTIAWIDDEINTSFLKPYVDELEENNYVVIKIKTTENLIQLLKDKAGTLSAIFVDIIMPPKGLNYSEASGGIRTGLVVLKNIKTEASLRDIPLIVVSNLNDDAIKKYCENNQIPYIEKRSYFSDEFVKIITEKINSRRI